MLRTLGYQRHHDRFAQRFLELDAEAVALDPADNAGNLEILTLEQQLAAYRRRRRGAEHRAALRDVEQHAIGLAMHRDEGSGEHDPVAPMAATIRRFLFAGKGHGVV